MNFLLFYLQLLAIASALPRFLNVTKSGNATELTNSTKPIVFKAIKPVFTISVAQAQQEFEQAMLVSQNALKQLVKVDNKIK